MIQSIKRKFPSLFFQGSSHSNKANGPTLLVNDQNKYKSMLIRTYSSVWMIGGFVFIIYMGHLYIWAMIVVIQIFMAKELFNLLRKVNEDRQLPGFRLLNWYYFQHSSTCSLQFFIIWMMLFIINLRSGLYLTFIFLSLQSFRHFFFTAMLYTYGRFLSRHLVNTVTSDKLLYKFVSGLIKYHMFSCYFLYIAG